MDVRELEHVVLEWIQIPPPQMEIMAAFKDFQGLLDASPVNPGNLRTVSGRAEGGEPPSTLGKSGILFQSAVAACITGGRTKCRSC